MGIFGSIGRGLKSAAGGFGAAKAIGLPGFKKKSVPNKPNGGAKGIFGKLAAKKKLE